MNGNTCDQAAARGWLQFGQNINSDNCLQILFKGAIKNIENAIEAIENNDFNRAHVQVIVAQEMIARWAVVFSQNSHEAKRSTQIYDYLQSKLCDANIKKDTRLLKAIMNFMFVISDTYHLKEDSSMFNSLSEISLTLVFSETG